MLSQTRTTNGHSRYSHFPVFVRHEGLMQTVQIQIRLLLDVDSGLKYLVTKYEAITLKSGLPRSGKKVWKMKFFPGQGKVREFQF